MNMHDAYEGQLPLLVGYSVLRTGDDTFPGRYDADQQVWVVDGDDDDDDVKPFVKAAKDLAELATKTEAKPERDDLAEPTLMALLQLVTKTLAQQERDD